MKPNITDQIELSKIEGKISKVNIAKGNFRFAPLMYLKASLEHIDTMPQKSFDKIIEKYVEMNIVHPFRCDRSSRVDLFGFRSRVGFELGRVRGVFE